MLTALMVGFFGWFSFLVGWVGVVVLLTYLLIVGALWDDDGFAGVLFGGLVLLAIPLAFVFGLGVANFPTWQDLLFISITYLGIGIVWSFFKWVVMIVKLKSHIEEFKVKGIFHDKLSGAGSKQVPWAELTKDIKGYYLRKRFFETYSEGRKFKAFLDDEKIEAHLDLVPTVSGKAAKARIFNWVILWPLSLSNYVFTELLKDLVDAIVEILKGVYNSIAVKLMKGLRI